MKTLKKTDFTIRGEVSSDDHQTTRLWVDETELSLADSLSIRSHSPTGFNWGYGGSGPAQTALAICFHIFESPYIAQTVYQRFKECFVARWQPQLESFVTQIDLTDFLIDHYLLIERGQQWEADEADLAGWDVVEQAEQLLRADAIPPIPAIPLALSPLFVVGTVVRVSRSILGSTPGQLALVYENYSGGGVSIITSTGNDLGGFSTEHQQQFLTFAYHCEGFTYEFISVMHLQKDWQRGLFLDVFKTV